MNALFTGYSAARLIWHTASFVPPDVQQAANQLDARMGLTLTEFACYGLLVAGLTSAVALLCSSLLLMLRYPRTKPVQPTLRVMHHWPAYPQQPVMSRIARANQADLRLRSARIRAGQFSN